MQPIQRIKEFGGWLNRYRHPSVTCHCEMTFSVYLPPQAATRKVPAVYWLSGMGGTDETAYEQIGAQRDAAQLGLALILPDTSPRGASVPDFPDLDELGQGAGFYVNATQSPWDTHYQMYDYVTRELPVWTERHLPLIPGRRSMMGHAMGGHGALICAIKNPGFYWSVSAFAPLCNPSLSPLGQRSFATYLGPDHETWKSYDATVLIEHGAPSLPLLIDQGTEDVYLADQLHPHHLQAACAHHGIPCALRMQTGYDHSYRFVATFIGEHLAYHAKALGLC